MKVTLSDDRIRRSSGKLEPGERVDLWDADKASRGLHLRISKSGAGIGRRWRFLYRYEGRRKVWPFAEYPATSIEAAQEKVKVYRQQVAEGRDPRAEHELQVDEEKRQRAEEERRRVLRETQTFSLLAEHYFARQREDGVESTDEAERQIKKDALPILGDLHAADVDPENITAVVKRIKKRGAKVLAKRVRGRIVSIYDWGLQNTEDRGGWSWWKVLQGNPAKAAEKALKRETPGDRVLTDDEVAALWTAADTLVEEKKLSPTVATLFRLRLLTGQHQAEIAKARDGDLRVDTVEANGKMVEVPVWEIPRENTKSKINAHVVPLSRQARELFDSLTPVDGWLFPGRRQGRERDGGEVSTHLQRVSSSLRKWVAEAGVKPLEHSDLRRTFNTGLERLGISFEVREACLNHVLPGTGRRHYGRYDFLLEKRAAFQRWADHVGKVVTGKEAKVLEFTGGAS